MRDEVARPRAIVLTTDCGADMDDQWALTHLALSPELDLRAVVTTHAPNLAVPAAQTSARIANEVLNETPLTNHPVVMAGSSTPLSERRPRPNPGVDFILAQSHNHTSDDRLIVLVIGAATDVASALLTDQTLGDRIEIVAMAFVGWPDGHDGFNVRNDVIAWQVLLESAAPITVGDAMVAKRDLAMTGDQASALFQGAGRTGRYLVKLLTDWLETHGELVHRVTGDAGSWPVWDEVVLAHLLGFTSSTTHPRPALQDDLTFLHPIGCPRGARTIQWITRVDTARLWRHLQRQLEDATAVV